MRRHWKLIAFELILEIILELGPASLSMMAAVAQYLGELSQVDGRESVQLIESSMKSDSDRRGCVMDLAQYAFTFSDQ